MMPQDYNQQSKNCNAPVEYGKFDKTSNKCKTCSKREACLYNGYMNSGKQPAEFSKKLANMNIAVYLVVLSLSLIGWFFKDSVPTEILTAATSAYSLIMLFYFGKAGSENVTKIKNTYNCYVNEMPKNILSGDTALTNTQSSDPIIADSEEVDDESIPSLDFSKLEELMQAELDEAEPLVANDSENEDYDNKKYSNLTGF